MSLKNKKSLGQHWLKDRAILDIIANYANSNDFQEQGISDSKDSPTVNLILEIGPGLGTLTSSLLKRFEKVIAVEYDKRLAENLPKSFPGKNLEVINQDFLKFNLSNIKDPYVVAGNIPYYITSPIITKLLETDNPPQKIVLLVQKEVAERIVAKDGKESVLSLSVRNRADATLGVIVPKEYFTPPPKVDSQVVILEPHPPLVSDDVIRFIQQGFSAPRKKLAHNLGIEKEQLFSIFDSLGISRNARPADLSLETWQALSKAL